MTFYVGQKVEYIGPDHSRIAAHYRQAIPKRSVIYTVRDIGIVAGEPAIRLNEIVNAPRQWANGFCELWMEEYLFRPIVDRKRSTETDISIFKALLNTNPADSRLKDEVGV